MPSSADLLADALERAADDIVAALPDVSAPTILIDGRSGAGKSSLADRVIARISGAKLLRMDSVYPGWAGMDAAADTVVRDVLTPRRAGLDGAYTAWDWTRNRAADVHPVAATGPLVVEGCGILTPAAARLADLTVWVDAPAAVRQERAFARDGDGYPPFWDMWAAQEDAHILRDAPRSHAAVVFDLP